MKFKFIFHLTAVLFALLTVIWSFGARKPAAYQSNAVVDSALVELSRTLLFEVKKQRNTHATEARLKAYSTDDLIAGLPNDDARKTFWINIYNAYYQIFAIRDKKKKGTIYTDQDIHFRDKSLSLDDVEHGILRKYRSKYSLGYLPQFLPSSTLKKLSVDEIDFRIHFALNCGAKSCPPIVIFSFNDINEQLRKVADTYLKKNTEVDTASQTLRVTSLMRWFKGDFDGNSGIRKIVGQVFKKNFEDYSIDYLPYDWSEDLMNFAE